MADATVDLDNDWEPSIYITERNASTGRQVAATSLSGLTCHLALTDGGDAIVGTSVALTQRGTTGIYYGILPKATLNTAVADYANTYLYRVLLGSSVEKSEKVLIRPTGRFA